jgi:hypothetical protein
MVRLTEFDGYLLWCLPDPGCDLPYLIRAYTFVNRDAAPSYPELAECMQRSVLAGVMPPPVGGHYRLSPEWRPRVRQWDGRSAVPEEGMIAFAEWLSSGEWPVVCPAGYALGRDEYEAAVAGHPRRG